MKFLKHFTGQPFVLATGIAALIHSTWSLGTLFSGEQPAIENITTWIEWIHFAGWILPALLIAIALDVGQVVTSHEIRTSGLTYQRGLTFFVFAFATYYLQWLYIVHHVPMLTIADGVSDIHKAFTIAMRDIGIWLIPLLLPLSTLLYTFSGDNAHDKPKHQEIIADLHEVSDMPVIAEWQEKHIATCDNCGKQFEKDSADSAERALRAHKISCEVQ